jgi:ankyrin repeat protein
VNILNEEYDAGRQYALRARIQQLPRDLYDLFLEIMTRSGHTTSGLLLCIQWVLFAQQPLTPKQLYFAILSGLEPHNLAQCHSDDISENNIKRYILNNSKGLVEPTKSKSSTIQFIHESVRDFLLKEHGLSKIWPGSSTNLFGQSHDTLKQCCLTYMNMEAVTDLKESSYEVTTQGFPFLEYANQGILYHANQAQNHDASQRDFLAMFPRSKWVKHHNIFQKHRVRRYTPEVSLLYILAETGMTALIRAHENRQSCFEVENERYGLPILAASATKSSAAIQTMLQLEAERLSKSSFANLRSQFPSGRDISYASGRNFTFDKKRELLHQLVEYGNEEASLFSLETVQYDIHLKDKRGKTVLMSTAESGFSVLAKMLIDRGADVSAADKDGSTPLHWALFNRNTDVAKLLIDRGADVSAADKDGWTPLHRAIYARNTEVAKLLIDRGADISAADINGLTPLHGAISTSGNTEVAKLLIDHGADISAADKDGWVPLHRAAENGNTEVAKLLIDHGADVSATNTDGWTPLHRAAENGNREIVQLLFKKGANIESKDNSGWTALSWAVKKGHKEIVQFLVEEGADIESKANSGHTALSFAVKNEHKEIVQFLVEKGADIESKANFGYTALSLAASNGHKEIVQFLVEKGADIESKANSGQTPLSCAAENGHREIVQLLFERGANIESKDLSNRTPLSLTTETGHVEIVRLLLGLGACCHPDDRYRAAKKGHIEIMHLLTEKQPARVEKYVNEANNINLQPKKHPHGHETMRVEPYADSGYITLGQDSSKTIQTIVEDPSKRYSRRTTY